jgi:O-antigen/teichoic acid export membrane protein
MRELVRAVSKTGTGAGVSLVLNAVAVKVIAVVLGPSGIGLFSLLRQTQQTAVVLGTVNGQTALVQGLASRPGEMRATFFSGAFWSVVVASVITVLAFVSLAPWLSPWLLGVGNGNLAATFRWLWVPILASVFLALLTGIVNSQRAMGQLSVVQVAAAGTTAVLAYPAAAMVRAGHPIAFIGLMGLSGVIALVVAFLVCARNQWLLHISSPRGQWEPARAFLSTAAVLLVTGLASSGAQLVVRAIVAAKLGLGAVGIFDVAWTLSMTYVMLVLTSLGTYYLPTLSKVSDKHEKGRLIEAFLHLGFAVLIPVIGTIIAIKPLVVSVLYSASFLPALAAIRWMLIGDFLKVTSFVLAMPMLAYRDMRFYFAAEVLWNVTFVTFAAVAVYVSGSVEGIAIGFVVCYLIYLCFTVWYCRSRHGYTPSRTSLLAFVAGLLVLVVVSWFSWVAREVQAWVLAGSIVAAVVYCGLFVAARARRGVPGRRGPLVPWWRAR